jgi:sugar lactone lactonase YvrE
MSFSLRTRLDLVGVGLIAAALACAQPPSGSYEMIPNWAKLPPEIAWGQVISVDPDPDGQSMWVFHRGDPALLHFDSSGKLLKALDAGMFVQPHGMSIDKEGFIWVTDARARDGKGDQVFKLNPSGKVILTLGKAGVAGDGEDTFNGPADVAIAADGDIFVADGHVNARVVKFSKDGKFIKAWGTKGPSPGQFNVPHTIAIDSTGRVFVGDRNNNRIQIFDQDGKLLAEWKQFGRPSGIYIAKDDTIYVTDSESNARSNAGFKRGIRIGSTKDGKVTAFIPDPEPDPDHTTVLGAEGVAADSAGNVYRAETGRNSVTKYLKK